MKSAALITSIVGLLALGGLILDMAGLVEVRAESSMMHSAVAMVFSLVAVVLARKAMKRGSTEAADRIGKRLGIVGLILNPMIFVVAFLVVFARESSGVPMAAALDNVADHAIAYVKSKGSFENYVLPAESAEHEVAEFKITMHTPDSIRIIAVSRIDNSHIMEVVVDRQGRTRHVWRR
jgi:hypothetical protein